MELHVSAAANDDIGSILALDHIAASGDYERCSLINTWVESNTAFVAKTDDEVVGYVVLTDTFFHLAFVEMLYVKEGMRRMGIGAQLLLAARDKASTSRVFTSTNLSNQPMQTVRSPAAAGSPPGN